MKALYIVATFLACCSLSNALEPTEDWYHDYHRETRFEKQPEETLVKALRIHSRPGLAVDLGCGTGKDTLYLLKKNWKVLAHDGEGRALKILRNRVPSSKADRLETLVAPFSEMELPDNVDLINASYSLPYCPPADFDACWAKIIDSLVVGGRFSGQFFGNRDEWAHNPSISTVSKQELRDMLARFEIEYLDEDEGRSRAARWHVFHVVAKKVT